MKRELYYFLFVFLSFVKKLGILQNQPPAVPVRILMDTQKWRVCMKHVSETWPALSNGGNNGVGLGTTSAADVLKYHFFELTTNVQGMAPNLTTYQGILGTFNMYK